MTKNVNGNIMLILLTIVYSVYGHEWGIRLTKDGDELKRHPIQDCDLAHLIGFALPGLAPGPQQLPLPLS